jgi:pre-mRNA-splicing helicase BRR2
MEMEDADRLRLLSMANEQVAEVAAFCNRYPSISLNAKMVESAEEDMVEVEVSLERDGFEETVLEPVRSRFLEEERPESWWIVVGDSSKNKLFIIKRVTFAASFSTKLKFQLPEPGEYSLLVYVICDSYLGCDQEVNY